MKNNTSVEQTKSRHISACYRSYDESLFSKSYIEEMHKEWRFARYEQSQNKSKEYTSFRLKVKGIWIER